MMEKILSLRDRTIFTFQDLEILFPERTTNSLQVALSRLVAKGKLVRLSKGIYGLAEYQAWELGNKLRTPSYITGFTVLFSVGAAFQVSGSITLATNRTQTLTVDSHRFVYKKIADKYLLRPEGIYTQKGVVVATPERALLDYWYWGGVQGIDNPRAIDLAKATNLNNLIYQRHNFEQGLNELMEI